MRSVATRGTTILTIITLFFVPGLAGHGTHRHKVEKLFKTTRVTRTVKCAPKAKLCPKHQTKTVKVYLNHKPLK